MINRWFVLPTLFATALSYGDPPREPIAKAWIDVEIQADVINVSPFGQLCHTAGSTQSGMFRYRFTASALGASGASNSLQSGEVVLRAGETTQLSQTQFNLTASANYRFELQLLKNDHVVVEVAQYYP